MTLNSNQQQSQTESSSSSLNLTNSILKQEQQQQQQVQTPQKFFNVTNKQHNYLIRRPALSTSKVPSSYNYFNNSNYMEQNIKTSQQKTTNRPISTHYNSSDSLINHPTNPNNIPRLKQLKSSIDNQQQQQQQQQSNISSSISSSIISNSTSTSGFISGSNSITNSLSSSKSNDYFNDINLKNYNLNSKNNSSINTNNTSNNNNRLIYEIKMKTLNESNQSPIKHRIASFQPSIVTSQTTHTRRKSSSNNQKSPSKQYYIDSNSQPISTSSRHTSNNSTKLLNHVLITPRNSTSTVLIDDTNLNTNTNTNRARHNSSNNLEQQSRRSSYISIRKHSQKLASTTSFKNSNLNSNKNNDDIIDDEDDDFVNELENVGLNYEDEDDDIFDYNENTNEHVNKQYHNSLSTASCIANEINCLNMYNITPDTSTSASSSSFSSASVNQETRYMLNNSQKMNKINSINQKQQQQQQTPINKPSTNSYPSTPEIANIRTKEFSIAINKSLGQQSKQNSKNLAQQRQMSTSTSNELAQSLISTRQYKIVNTAPPQLPTTQQSFFMHNSNTDYALSESLINFSHFDIQSIYFNYKNVRSIISSLHTSMNIKTGASAASRQSSLENLNKTLPPIPVLNQSSSKLNQLKPIEEKINTSMPNSSRARLSTSMYMYNDSDKPPQSPSKTNIKTDNKPIFNLNDSNISDCVPNENKSCDLVEECPCFRLEIGGDAFKGLGLVQDVSQRRMMKLNSVNILDKIYLNYKKEIIDLIEANNDEPFTIEYQDWGAYYYRYFFNNQDHANYIGNDTNIGPVAISIRRDKLLIEPPTRSNSSNTHSSNKTNNNERAYDYAYRFILRTSDLNTLRGTILEEHLNSKSSNSNSNTNSSKGLAHKDVINYLIPELNLNCLRLAESKINEKLIELDEQYLIKNHKIGVLLCKSGQSTEEEMYNNKDSTPAFDEFLQLLGEKICLKGFQNYRGGLDNTSDTTGTHSVYTKFRNKEIMFHVSTHLPYSTNDRQQLTRKRHIGNDLVTIVFQEPGSLPFSPKTIRSQYQHIFIIVRVMNPNSYNTQYSVAVSYSKDIPAFGPPLPKNPLFLKSKEFREFLLAKIVNADVVGLKCEKFTQIRMRTRNGTLKDLVDSYQTKFTLDNCANGAANSGSLSQKLALFNFGSMKQKKLRSKSLQAFNSSITSTDELTAINLCKLNGAIFWNIELIEDFQYLIRNCCLLGISKQNIVVIDAQQKCVLFSIGCNAVLGWTLYENDSSFVLYFDLGECVNIKLKSKTELYSVIKRLEFFTKGCKTIELSLEKKDCGPLGFNIHPDGVVTEVELYSLAHYRGLKQGSRIVKIGDYFVINLSHEKMIDLLRNSICLTITFLMPFDDGSARRGQDDSFSLYAYLRTCSSLNERQIDSIKTTPVLTNFQKYPRLNLPSLAAYSPQKSRRLTTSSNISKIIHRLSTSGSVNENNENDQKQMNNETTSFYPNSLYNENVNNNNNNNRKENVELTSIQSPKKIFTNNGLEWTKMVQTATKTFENVQRVNSVNSNCNANLINGSDSNYFFNDSTVFKTRLNSSNVSNQKAKLNIDLKECIEHNMEKNASYDELKERLLHLQLELNKEKHEKSKIVRQEAHIREEYLNLHQEYLKMREKLKIKENVVLMTPKTRRYSSKNEFIDCGNDIKSKQSATPQVLRLNNETFFPNHNYSITNDSHI